jgi:hypothetical protein
LSNRKVVLIPIVSTPDFFLDMKRVIEGHGTQDPILSLLAILSFAPAFHLTFTSDISFEHNGTSVPHTHGSSISISIRLLALKRIEAFPLHHPAIHNDPRLRLFWLHHAVMRHAPTVLATVVSQPLLAPYVRLCFSFDLNLIGFVVSPESTVATTDGAEAFVGGFAEGWEGDADGFAVAGYLELGLLGGIGCHRGGGLWSVRDREGLGDCRDGRVWEEQFNAW